MIGTNQKPGGSRCRKPLGESDAEPKGDTQTEAATIGNHHEFFDLIGEPFATFAVAVKGVVDLFDVTPNQSELSLHWVCHLPIIRECHAPPRIPVFLLWAFA